MCRACGQAGRVRAWSAARAISGIDSDVEGTDSLRHGMAHCPGCRPGAHLSRSGRARRCAARPRCCRSLAGCVARSAAARAPALPSSAAGLKSPNSAATSGSTSIAHSAASRAGPGRARWKSPPPPAAGCCASRQSTKSTTGAAARADTSSTLVPECPETKASFCCRRLAIVSLLFSTVAASRPIGCWLHLPNQI